jgi:hypothetical protein
LDKVKNGEPGIFSISCGVDEKGPLSHLNRRR